LRHAHTDRVFVCVEATPEDIAPGFMRSLIPIIALAVCFVSFAQAASGTHWNNPPKERVAGMEHRSFQSSAVKAGVGYNICLPPQYFQKKDQRFPVIYYLHGYEGNESSYLDYANYWREAASKFQAAILIFVNGGETSFFCDSADGSIRAETLLVKELIPHIDQQFRTLTNASGRALHGYSMGGFGALKLAFQYPETFGTVVAYGSTLGDAAAFKKHLGKVYAQVFGNDAKHFANNDPFVLAEQNAGKIRDRIAISLVVGTKDEFLERHRALHAKLQQLKIPHGYEEIRGGGHKKEDLYRPAALRAFQFTAEHFSPGRSK
jgi:enterochelin esterase-like enzyme